MKNATKKRRRRNPIDGSTFPKNAWVTCKAIRFNDDNTVTVAVEDQDLPASLKANPRRRK